MLELFNIPVKATKPKTHQAVLHRAWILGMIKKPLTTIFMEKTFRAEASILIHVPIARVWQALTAPELIKQYLFGTEAVSDWQVGSTITYRGTWEGKTYEDKGKILELDPEKHLLTTYWSSFSGLPDAPENYQTVAYDLSAEKNGTKLTVTQDNIKTEASRDHSAQNWKKVLENLKSLLEK